MKRFFVVALLVSFFVISCDAGKLSRPDANTDDNNNTDKDVVVTDDDSVTDDTILPDESQDETTDEKQDTVLPDETADETADETTDETVDETTDEVADEVPDVDTCNNECTLGTKQCDPSNLDDSQVCMKDSYGCSRWVFSETCNVTPYHSSYICEAGNCKPDCVDECYEGVTSCDGDDLMKCVMAETGCTAEVLDTDCADGGQECEQLIGGAQCVGPEVELDLGSIGNNPQPRTADHQMKGNRFTMKSTVRLTRFSYALRPMENQNFIFFVYVDEGSYSWRLVYASAALAVASEGEAKYYESPAIDIPLEKDKEYAIGVFFDKEVRYIYTSGDAGDFGAGNHWGLFSKDGLPNDVHTPPDTTDSEVYNDYTYAMKLYYR